MGREGKGGAHRLSDQAARSMLASRQPRRDPEGGAHKLPNQAARRTLASRQRGEGSGRGNSLAVRSGRQANVSEPAARRGIRKGELTRCQIRPPGER